ncbi:MAG: D-galactarate dehydratase [Anaerolineales bacterium]|nr:MAG: D-galactarate dehydratase [Anaerolineales bacterium]
MQPSAILIDRKDNVATALRQLQQGNSVQVGIEDYSVTTPLLQDIPFGHKYALKDIRKGETVIKYGEVIGLATEDIQQGQHVHVHNIESQKGRGDKK